jgi:hypothetical protein
LDGHLQLQPAGIVLLSAAGLPNAEIARSDGGPLSGRRKLGLADEDRPGRPPLINDADVVVATLFMHLCPLAPDGPDGRPKLSGMLAIMSMGDAPNGGVACRREAVTDQRSFSHP